MKIQITTSQFQFDSFSMIRCGFGFQAGVLEVLPLLDKQFSFRFFQTLKTWCNSCSAKLKYFMLGHCHF
jgi:hypothetical protein